MTMTMMMTTTTTMTTANMRKSWGNRAGGDDDDDDDDEDDDADDAMMMMNPSLTRTITMMTTMSRVSTMRAPVAHGAPFHVLKLYVCASFPIPVYTCLCTVLYDFIMFDAFVYRLIHVKSWTCVHIWCVCDSYDLTTNNHSICVIHVYTVVYRLILLFFACCTLDWWHFVRVNRARIAFYTCCACMPYMLTLRRSYNKSAVCACRPRHCILLHKYIHNFAFAWTRCTIRVSAISAQHIHSLAQ